MNVSKSMLYVLLLTPLLVHGMGKESLPEDVQELHQIIERQQLDIVRLTEKIKILEEEKKSARTQLIEELYEATLESRRQMLFVK